ncbi:hypothetical protein Zmor_028082 [Zophobas morio]|uniref:Ionotropic glutamate receptor C-terminal domain-containing protein n=1 Tax=Zophobas morio TaxID=2755281 RepID=A0AA38HPC0_9CUCU|nr:hypothetical protein Zmor_028082 [Zophobas morio]
MLTLPEYFKLIHAPYVSFDGVIKELVFRNFDFGIGGLTITYDRYKKLQFSSVLMYEKLGFMFVYQKSFLKKLFTFQLFAINISVTILATLLVFSVSVFLVVRKFDRGVRLRFARVALVFLGSGLEQAFNLQKFTFRRTEITVRVLFMTYWFFAIIINTIFKSQMLALIVSTPTHQITLSEFLEEQYELVIDRSRGSVKLFFEEEEALLSHFSTTYKNNVCDFIVYAASHKAVIFSEVSRIALHSQSFGTNPHAWPFMKDIPFVNQFNIHVRHVISGGLLSSWEQKALLTKNIKRMSSKQTENVVGFEAFILHFAVYLFFLTHSILCFVVELLYNKLREQ